MNNIPSQVLEDIEFIKRAKRLDFKVSSEIDKNIKFNRDLINTITQEDKEVLLYVKEEFIASKRLFDDLIKSIESKNVDYKILSATSSYFKNYVHPLVGLISWNGNDIDLDINWKHDGSDLQVKLFESHEYQPNQLINEERKYRGILSIRKSNRNRDYFFSNYSPTIKDGILRYAKLPYHTSVSKSDSERVKYYPTWLELQKEYQQSYFSFIIETRDNEKYEDASLDTSFTEKTLLGLMTGTMPIVLGYNGFVKSLEDIGIKVWNNEFGFDSADEREDYSEVGFDYFNKCIENINKLSMNEVKEYWKLNKEIIQNNYNIISSILCNKDYRFDYIMNYKPSRKKNII